jgi:hypothetical protein
MNLVHVAGRRYGRNIPEAVGDNNPEAAAGAVGYGAAYDCARGDATHNTSTYRAAKAPRIRIIGSEEREKANTRRSHKRDKPSLHVFSSYNRSDATQPERAELPEKSGGLPPVFREPSGKIRLRPDQDTS